MELREYWLIIWRRAWIPVALIGVVATISLLTRQPEPLIYTTSLRFIVGVKPEHTPGQFNYDGYYVGASSEFVADDLSVVVTSQAFAADVSRHLAEAGSKVQLSPGTLSGITFTDKQHRILKVSLTWGNPAELQAIGDAVTQAVVQDSAQYLTQLGVPGAQISLIDPLSPPAPIPASLTRRLDLPIRLLIALIAGLGLTFLLHYLDPSIRTTAELQSLGIPVLATVPDRKRH